MKSMLASIALTAGGIYLLLCLLLFLFQRQMLYLPQYTHVSASSTDFSLRSEGVDLRGWRVNPGQEQALLYFGGNAESVGYQRERFAQWFPQHTIYLIAYRGYGASGGSPSEAALKADALALYDQIAPQHRRIDLLGRSVGSGVALHLAARREVGRLALITPYDSLVAVARRHYPMFPVNWLLRERFDTAADAAQIRSPTLLLIARHDEIIAPAHAEALAATLPRPPQIQWLDSDHNSVDMDIRFAHALQRFFRGESVTPANAETVIPANAGIQ